LCPLAGVWQAAGCHPFPSSPSGSPRTAGTTGTTGETGQTGENWGGGRVLPPPNVPVSECPVPGGAPRLGPLPTPSPRLAGSCRSGRCQGSPGRNRTQGLVRGVASVLAAAWGGGHTLGHPRGDACPTPQGDRGFDGLPGLPGEKGHRVSGTSPRPLLPPPSPPPPHPLSSAG